MAVDDLSTSSKIGALSEQLEFELNEKTITTVGGSGDSATQGDELYQIWTRCSKMLPKDHPRRRSISIELCSSFINFSIYLREHFKENV